MLTAEMLRDSYVYEKDTGLLINKKTKRSVGHKKQNGYLRADINGRTYGVHVLAFLYVNGRFPSLDIDHVNHLRDDNRWVNLREVSRRDNMRNAKLSKANKSGFTGVGWCKQQQQWYAAIMVDGKNVKLGRFNCKLDAVAARIRANKEFGFHKNHGVLNA